MNRSVILAMLAAAGTAWGATLPMDTWELRLGGAVDFDNPQDKLDWLIEGGAGYLVRDNIEVGGLADWRYDGTDMGAGLGVFGELNLELDSFVMPYAGLGLRYRFGDYYRHAAGSSYAVLQPALGLKFFLSESVAVYTELVFEWASEEAFVQGDESKRHSIGMKTGLRCYL